MPKRSWSRFMVDADILLNNASSVPELSRKLADYGYDEERRAEGLALLREANALSTGRERALGDNAEARAAYRSALGEARSAYARTLKLARLALDGQGGLRDGVGRTALGLSGRRKADFAGWHLQAATFYDVLVNEPRYDGALGCFGYTKARLEDESRLVEAARSRGTALVSAAAEALAATARRDEALKRLERWVSRLRAACAVALSPEEAAVLGPLAPGRPERRRVARRKAGSVDPGKVFSPPALST